MCMAEIARVSRKGQVVIPVHIRRKLRVSRLVTIKEEGGRIVMKPVMSLEDAFGIDGSKMLDVAREIVRDRRREIESERP